MYTNSYICTLGGYIVRKKYPKKYNSTNEKYKKIGVDFGVFFRVFFLAHQEALKKAQKTVDTWIKTTGVRYFNELTNMAILMEEVGEVARIMARQYGEQSYKKSDEAIDLGDELADVLFVLICLANQTGINLTEALEKNLAKKSIRDANRHQNNKKLSGSDLLNTYENK